MPICFYHKCYIAFPEVSLWSIACWMLSSERPGNILITSVRDREIYVNHFIQKGSMSAVLGIDIQWLTPSQLLYFSQFRFNFVLPSAAYSLAVYKVASYPESAMAMPYQLQGTRLMPHCREHRIGKTAQRLYRLWGRKIDFTYLYTRISCQTLSWWPVWDYT